MSRIWRAALPMLCLSLALFSAVPAAAQTFAPEPEPYTGSVLCSPVTRKPLPRIAGGCLRLGPAGYLDRMARDGIHFPLQPLAYRVVDPELSDVGYSYMYVRDNSSGTIPVYASLEDARRRRDPVKTLKTFFSYIAYRQIVDDRYVQTVSGYWVWRGDVSPVSSKPPFRGLIFTGSPTSDFGWAYDRVAPRSGPGEIYPELEGADLLAQQVVRIYSSLEVDGVEWDCIGPDRWVSDLHINRVHVSPTAPPGVAGRRWIEVDLDEQVLAAYEDNRLVFATVIASGRAPLDTHPGLYNIYLKLETDVMSGATKADGSDYYYLDRVPWTMYFDEGRALHGAYWRTRLGRPQSHGCVNLAIGDARWLFDWAQQGDWVYVRGTEPVEAGTAGG